MGARAPAGFGLGPWGLLAGSACRCDPWSRLTCAGWLPRGFPYGTRLLIAQGWVTPRAASPVLTPTVSLGGGPSVRQPCQRPAPAGQFAGDGDVGHNEPFLAFGVADPAGVQTLVASVCSRSRRGRRLVPPPLQHHTGPVGLAGANSLSAAIAVIFSSSRSRRAQARQTVSYPSSNAAWVADSSKR
jgi:hypothetical protein